MACFKLNISSPLNLLRILKKPLHRTVVFLYPNKNSTIECFFFPLWSNKEQTLDISRAACLEFATMSHTSLSSLHPSVVITEFIKLKMLLPSFMQTSQLVQYFNGGYKAHTHTHTHTRTESMVISKFTLFFLRKNNELKTVSKSHKNAFLPL